VTFKQNSGRDEEDHTTKVVGIRKDYMTSSRRLKLGISDKEEKTKYKISVLLILFSLIFSGCDSLPGSYDVGFNQYVKGEYLNNLTLLSEIIEKECAMRGLNFSVLPSSKPSKIFAFKCENDFIYETYQVSLTNGYIEIIDEVSR
jgi:hypothetical protein